MCSHRNDVQIKCFRFHVCFLWWFHGFLSAEWLDFDEADGRVLVLIVLPNPYNRHIRYDLIFLTLISIIVQHSEGIPFGFYRSRTNVVSVGRRQPACLTEYESSPRARRGRDFGSGSFFFGGDVS